MKKHRIFVWSGLFESNLSAAEWAWRLFAFAVVAAGGTTAGLLAKASELFNSLGPLAWLAVGLLSAGSFSVILLLIKTASLRDAEAEYTRAMAALEARSVNPLLASYADTVIPLEDLRLPGQLLHERKQFKRCKFVGPGAVVLMGGTFVRSGFHDCGDVIPLPINATVTGIVVLQDCTVEECEFFRVTLLAPSDSMAAFKLMGGRIAGEA